jgi:hypothetical protein
VKPIIGTAPGARRLHFDVPPDPLDQDVRTDLLPIRVQIEAVDQLLQPRAAENLLIDRLQACIERAGERPDEVGGTCWPTTRIVAVD